MGCLWTSARILDVEMKSNGDPGKALVCAINGKCLYSLLVAQVVQLIAGWR
jgi:hypothetical protein